MNLRACLLALPAFALLLPLTACDDAPGTTVTADSGVVCCPIDPPSCDCPRAGGVPNQFGVCQRGSCDAPPPSFYEIIDEHGCRALAQKAYTGTNFCGPQPPRDDGGTDASRDGSSDAQPDAAPDASDASNADAATTEAGAP
jgi:hypothetical protein